MPTIPSQARIAVVSTIGTSTLTNKAPQELATLLRDTANKKMNGLSEEDRKRIKQHADKREIDLGNADTAEMQKMSAEMNGFIQFRKSVKAASRMRHYLLHTDTFQGERASQIVRACLLACDQTAEVEIVPITNFNTESQTDFADGVQSILSWCDAALPDLKTQQYRIAFNLVGGFKSFQAVMQTVGMLYADEIIYVFEGVSSALIRIPRLPLLIDEEPLRKHAALFMRLIYGRDTVTAEDVAMLPETLVNLVEMGDGDVLADKSVWAETIWKRVEDDILQDKLLEYNGIEYTKDFKDDYHNSDAPARIELQKTLAKAAVKWKEGGLKKLREDGGLQYENYENGHGIGHFRINKGDRISSEVEGNILRLRHFGKHDYVNKNP